MVYQTETYISILTNNSLQKLKRSASKRLYQTETYIGIFTNDCL